ncbi:MAG: hypothetical protein H0U49_01890 [Parachlamydiaceae bacterium]|nr:hypothetical protein [Parachlamydiaceae bacterium]
MNPSMSLLSNSEFVEEYISILLPIETLIANAYRENPSLHDHDVLRVFEALLKLCKAKFQITPYLNISLKVFP